MIEVTPDEVKKLAQLGYHNLISGKNIEKAEKKEKEETQEKSAEEQIAELNDKVEKMNQERENERKTEELKKEIKSTMNEFEFIKENPELKEVIKLAGLAQMQLNPNWSMKKAFVKVVDDMTKGLGHATKSKKKKDVSNGKIDALMNAAKRGSGGVPGLEGETKFTPKDVTSGKSRIELIKLLSSAESED